MVISLLLLIGIEAIDPCIVGAFARAILIVLITEAAFMVPEELRSMSRQDQIVASDISRTMNSRHLIGDAEDLGTWVDREVSWHWPHYDCIAAAMKQVTDELGVELEWGGDQHSFKDGPHCQLP